MCGWKELAVPNHETLPVVATEIGIGNTSRAPYIAMVKVQDYPMWRESHLDKSTKKLIFK